MKYKINKDKRPIRWDGEFEFSSSDEFPKPDHLTVDLIFEKRWKRHVQD